LADNVTALLPHFDAYPLRARKAADYTIYREGVVYMATVGRPGCGGGVRRWHDNDNEYFLKLKDRLEEGRRFK
jgi:hypothetical protein